MITGAIMLPMEPLMARDWYAAFLVTVIGSMLGLLVIIIIVAQRVIHSRRQWQDGSTYFEPPRRGVTVGRLDPDGMIRSSGELWKARSDDGTPIAAGIEVEVVKAESLQLWVRPIQNKET